MSQNLKDLLDKKICEKLAALLKAKAPHFDEKAFHASILKNAFLKMELKQRISFLSQAMGEHISGSYPQQLKVILHVAPEFNGLQGLIFPDFIEKHGLGHFDISMQALKEVTCYSSSEFAVRAFIKNQPTKALESMFKWSKDKNEHVRRLASEGCRPRLPWSYKLDEFISKPQLIIPILSELRADESLYVRKSVANNLNDISKDNPDLALQLATQWIGKNAHTDWILKHGLRSLLKKGDIKALGLFGTGQTKNIQLKKLKIEKSELKIGESQSFSVDILVLGSNAQKLRVEYVIHFAKLSGKKSRKIFKMGEKMAAPGLNCFSRKHSFKQMSTRLHYPGKHELEIIINGKSFTKKAFKLK